MGSDLNITKHLQDYILKNGLKLHPIQKEIIDYNLSLGDIKRMQISISQCQFLHLIIKISKIILPSSGNAKAIDNVLKPVKVPISKTFVILEILIIKCKN